MIYDLILRGGTVVDGTNRPPFAADLFKEIAFKAHGHTQRCAALGTGENGKGLKLAQIKFRSAISAIDLQRLLHGQTISPISRVPS